MSSVSNRAAAVLVILCVVVSAGCDDDGRPDRVPVSGRVLIDGRPLVQGAVCIVPSNARSAFGNLGPDGRFTLSCFGTDDGVVPGTHKVAVTSFESVGQTTRKWYAPKEYADTATSGLTVTIDRPDDNLVLNLTWKGGEPFVERLVDGEWQKDGVSERRPASRPRGRESAGVSGSPTPRRGPAESSRP